MKKKIVFYTDQIYMYGGIEIILSKKLNFLSNIDYYDVSLITSEQKNIKDCLHINKNISRFDLGINYFRDKSYFHLFK